ncbi:MAG: dephospho-CoA kinase [Gammaproteobacteria bacterium]
MRTPLRVGVTGGIGSGKTTVCELFAGVGVPVIDADLIARELVAPGQPALTAIIAQFGEDVIGADGELKRERMRSLIFTDRKKRKCLEEILHPRIYAEIERRASDIKTPYCILCIPLLLESGGASRVDQILVVDAPEALQKQRVVTRDGVSLDAVEAMLKPQLDRRERLRLADAVIDNQGDIEGLRRQVLTLHQHFLSLAGAAANADGQVNLRKL